MVIHVSVVESYSEVMATKKYGHRAMSLSSAPAKSLCNFFSPENISTIVNTM